MRTMRRSGYRGYLSPYLDDIHAMAKNGFSPTRIAKALNKRDPGIRAVGSSVRHVLTRIGDPIVNPRDHDPRPHILVVSAKINRQSDT